MNAAETAPHPLLRGYPDWLFWVFTLCYLAMSSAAVAWCWPH